MDNGVENYESVLAHGLVSTNGRQVKVNAVLCVGYDNLKCILVGRRKVIW